MSDRTFTPDKIDPEAAKFVAIDTRTAYALFAALNTIQLLPSQVSPLEPWMVAEISAAHATLRTAWVDAPYTVSATLRLR